MIAKISKKKIIFLCTAPKTLFARAFAVQCQFYITHSQREQALTIDVFFTFQHENFLKETITIKKKILHDYKRKPHRTQEALLLSLKAFPKSLAVKLNPPIRNFPFQARLKAPHSQQKIAFIKWAARKKKTEASALCSWAAPSDMGVARAHLKCTHIIYKKSGLQQHSTSSTHFTKKKLWINQFRRSSFTRF